MLAENWKVIRDEGLALLNDVTGAFELEAEDLRDKGEWRQFTLYRQGKYPYVFMRVIILCGSYMYKHYQAKYCTFYLTDACM